jgi:hypothetical protein
MRKVKSDFDVNQLRKQSKVKVTSNKKLTSKDKIRPDVLQDYTVPLTFEKHIGMDGKDLFLPKGVKPEIQKKKVIRFKIGSKMFSFDDVTKNYLSEDGTEYRVPNINFQTPTFVFDEEVPMMEATVSVSNAPNSDGLQMIQTDFTRGNNLFTEEMRRYKMNVILEKTDKTERLVFVDGGKNSPRVLADKNNHSISDEKKSKPSHPDRPYYYTQENLSNEKKANMQWDKKEGTGSIILYDTPSATTSPGLFELNRFETSAIIENWLGTGMDLIIGTFTWACVTPPKGGKPNTNFMDKTVEVTAPSAQHLEIIELDYPEYAKQKLLPKK